MKAAMKKFFIYKYPTETQFGSVAETKKDLNEPELQSLVTLVQMQVGRALSKPSPSHEEYWS
jgi:hypothetical protein